MCNCDFYVYHVPQYSRHQDWLRDTGHPEDNYACLKITSVGGYFSDEQARSKGGGKGGRASLNGAQIQRLCLKYLCNLIRFGPLP